MSDRSLLSDSAVEESLVSDRTQSFPRTRASLARNVPWSIRAGEEDELLRALVSIRFEFLAWLVTGLLLLRLLSTLSSALTVNVPIVDTNRNPSNHRSR